MSSDFIIQSLLNVDYITDIVEVSPGLLEVRRTAGPPVSVAVSDEEWIEVDHVKQLLRKWPNLHAVVVAGRGRHVSGEARNYGRDHEVAVMVLRDFMGSLLYGTKGRSYEYEQQWKKYAREALENHPKVSGVEYECESVLLVQRRRLSEVRVQPVDIYTLGAADVLRIRSEHPDIDAILNASKFRSISGEAQKRGTELRVGVFDLSGIYSALHRDWPQF